MSSTSVFRIKVIFQLLMLFGLLSGATAQVEVKVSDVMQQINGKEYYIHLVGPGQTLFSISRAYNVSVEEIIFENPETADGLRAYQNLKIPVTSRDVEIANEIRSGKFDYIYHIVTRGQTLFSISRLYEVDEKEILGANPGSTSDLKVGQYLKIPIRAEETSKQTPGAGYEDHIVKPGETFFSISRQHGITVEELRAANPGVEYPKTGSTLRVPVQKMPDTAGQALPRYYVHVVKPGETLYGIARQYMVPVDSIYFANQGISEHISPGLELNIPLPEETRKYITHRVKEEQTKLKTIAKLYETDIQIVKDLNPKLSRRVYYNQQIRIPVAPGASIPEPVPATSIKVEDVKTVEPEKPSSSACKPEPYNGRPVKVALMVPLYLEEVRDAGKDRIEEIANGDNYKPFQFLSFYNGCLQAVDSLKKQGLNVQLYVYDVDQEISKTIKVLQEPALQEMDLIIGPFFRTSFKYVANFARIFDINIINPLSRSQEVIDQYDHAFKLLPSEVAGLYQAAEFIRQNFSGHRIILARHNQYKDVYAINELRGLLASSSESEFSFNNALLSSIVTDELMPEEPGEDFVLPDRVYVEGKMVDLKELESDPEGYTRFPNDFPQVIYLSDSLRGIAKYASVIRPNLVVAFSDNEVFAIEIMTALNEVKDTFNLSLMGLYDWQQFNNLETSYLLNLNTHLLAPFFLDYENPGVKTFIREYRQRYLDEPDDFAFTGFDASYYFLSAYLKYGKRFEHCLKHHQPELLRSKFLFKKMPGKGYENIFWNIYHYSGYEMIRKPNTFDFEKY